MSIPSTTLRRSATDHSYRSPFPSSQSKLEAQYAAKRDVQLSEISDLRQQLEHRSQEAKNQTMTIESLKGINEELKRAFAVSSAGMEGSKNLQESAKDLERTRKAIAVQLADFEGSKRSLMRDLQNRCEKVSHSSCRCVLPLVS